MESEVKRPGPRDVSIDVMSDTEFHELLVMEGRKKDKKLYDTTSTAEMVDCKQHFCSLETLGH